MTLAAFLKLLAFISNMFVIAHRGASAYAPENTLKAFHLAEEMGANAIELDVRLSRDGVPVVIHDPVVSRVSNANGKVSSFSFKELKRLKIGTQRIPSLKEVVEETSIPLFVDVKEAGATGKVLDMLTGFKKRSVIVSFHDEVLVSAKKRGFKTGFVSLLGLTAASRAEKLSADYMLCFKPLLGRDVVAVCAKKRVKPIAWVVDNRREALRFKSIGVFGIITNKPDVLLR